MSLSTLTPKASSVTGGSLYLQVWCPDSISRNLLWTTAEYMWHSYSCYLEWLDYAGRLFHVACSCVAKPQKILQLVMGLGIVSVLAVLGPIFNVLGYATCACLLTAGSAVLLVRNVLALPALVWRGVPVLAQRLRSWLRRLNWRPAAQLAHAGRPVCCAVCSRSWRLVVVLLKAGCWLGMAAALSVAMLALLAWVFVREAALLAHAAAVAVLWLVRCAL